MAITTKTNVERYLLVAIDSSFDTQIATWITAINNYMDKMTNRQLIADSTDAEFKYDGTGKKSLMIDDFISIESVELGDEDITDYVFLYPANSIPTWRLESDDYYFTKGRQNITITGKKGFAVDADLPEDLKFAATVLVAGIVNASHNSKGEIKSESIGRYSVSYTTDAQKIDYDMAMDIIKSYKRVR
jgi:hypothetical protein